MTATPQMEYSDGLLAIDEVIFYSEEDGKERILPTAPSWSEFGNWSITKAFEFLKKITAPSKESKEPLEIELIRNGIGEWSLTKAKELVKEVQKIYPYASIPTENLLAISAYTSTTCYYEINQALRRHGALNAHTSTQILKWHHTIYNILCGFRALPSFWGRVYRGIRNTPQKIIKSWCEGNEIRLDGFTSTSKSLPKALSFTQGNDSVLFIIESQTGREIQSISFHPDEEEVIFRPWTYFKIKECIEPRNKYDCWKFRIEELYPDIRGRRVVLWISNKPQLNRDLLDYGETRGVTFVLLRNLEDANKFLKSHEGILSRPRNRLRMVLDFQRAKEADAQSRELALSVMKIIKKKKNWAEMAYVYTNENYYSEAKEQLRKEKRVHVTIDKNEIKNWISFQFKGDSRK